MIKEGEKILLFSEGKTFYTTAIQGKSLCTHLGTVSIDDVMEKDYGDFVLSSSGKCFWILNPLIADRTMKVKRKTAIIYPKDLSFLIFSSGISSGSRVIEAGCGSGASAIAFAHYVKPSGKVYSYEIRDDFIALAEENIKANNLSDYIVLKKRNVYSEGFDETDVDFIFLDLPEPWHTVKFAHSSLKPSGVIMSISPTYNQIEIMCKTLDENGFIMIDTNEVIVRRILVREGKTRPQERIISHTAFISSARKVKK